MKISQPSIAVVTASAGHKYLESAILSVKNQSYPAKHYIFVDGEQYHEQVRAIAQKYPEVIVTYLPMNTGGDGWTNSHINAIAPFLIKEDIICYLDEDNWYDDNHTQAIAQAFSNHDIRMAYTLRRFYDEEKTFIYDDNYESLGFWGYTEQPDYQIEFQDIIIPLSGNFTRTFPVHIDTNCMAFDRSTARELAKLWCEDRRNDTHVLSNVFEAGYPMLCTGKRTVNYVYSEARLSTEIDKILAVLPRKAYSLDDIKALQKTFLVETIKAFERQAPDKPWERPYLLINNQLIAIE